MGKVVNGTIRKMILLDSLIPILFLLLTKFFVCLQCTYKHMKKMYKQTLTLHANIHRERKIKERLVYI